jgi:hypothetical protein
MLITHTLYKIKCHIELFRIANRDVLPLKNFTELPVKWFSKFVLRYGFDGLRKALTALNLHLEYQKSYQTLSGLKKIFDEFMDVLPEHHL